MANVFNRLFGNKDESTSEDKDDPTPEWAVETIEAAQRSRSTSLNLVLFSGEDRLEEIPNAVFEMEWLKSLNLSGNQLTVIPSEIGQLQNLTELRLYKNQLTAVPPEIAKLQNLTTLNLSSNRLAAVPAEIGQLQNLTRLDLSSNHLKAVPSEIAKLQNLTTLDLGFNKLKAVPSEIAKLQRLTTLWLSYNQLTAVSAWLFNLPKLEKLYLHDNPIQTPPQEVLELKKLSGNRIVNLNKVRAYFDQLAEEGVDTLYEAKLIIIGEAGAGKTTLVKKLQDPTYTINPTEPSTEGIDVAEWTFPLPQTSDFLEKSDVSTDNNFRVNVWDFGGQEIYHATHKFFLTRRSLYALVADAREQKTDFYYWLNVVELLSDNSPALIISNEKQNRAWPFNENQLRGEFNSLKDVFPVNLADENNRRLYKIIDAIKYHIVQLPHVGQTLPKTWVRVREVLEEDPRNTMPLPEYLDLCQRHGFRRHDDKLQLSDYLHDLGVCLHYQDDPLLNKTLILKPEWGTAAVYAVLESDQVKANQGRFSRANLDTIWHEEKYAPWRDELLQLMVRFQLCYQLPGNGDYIAPQLLSENKPNYPWDENDNLQLRFRYPTFMPKGILTSFIVATHRLIANQDWVWKTGVILENADARAEIIEHYQRREITIRVQGRQKRDLLTKIGYEFEKIHSDFPERLQIKQLIPCNCSQCKGSGRPYFFDFGRLKKRLAAGKTTAECDDSYETVDVWRLIDDVGARQQALDKGMYVGGDYIHIEGGISNSQGLAIGRDADGSAT
ncbi:COR domain-containing protein [Candidatus Leptofilum sp.]|uniref:COR domain-containing protein n=1 Tax=Candidatus Leptofilum sp. TaxID=3241576 RepID=UPI003B5B5835